MQGVASDKERFVFCTIKAFNNWASAFSQLPIKLKKERVE